MARITKAQKAGLDFLDQILFNELVLHRGMNIEERHQIETIVESVTQMAESKYSGHEAEIIKHLAYHFLAVTLASTHDEWKKFIAVGEVSRDIAEKIEAVENHMRSFQMALMLAITEKSTGFKASFALEILETLKDEFIGFSALVKGDLVRRCFVFEFEDASVKSYCWLTITGVLAVTKNSPARINNNLSAEFRARLTLLADYEMIAHKMKVMFSKNSIASAYLGQHNFDLKETTIDRLLDVQRIFNESCAKSSLHTIPLLSLRDLKKAAQVQEFFEQWGNRQVRLRMHIGTLAGWLGVLGSGMVDMRLAREYDYAAQEKRVNGIAPVETSDLKVPAIFNACDNKGTITELVKERLLEYGLQISSDALYRNHSKMSKTTLRFLHTYCEMTREAGLVNSATEDDAFYISLLLFGS